MRAFQFPVVPICERQRRDVHTEDLLEDGLFRKCSIYKSGGGYDRFESIFRRRNPQYPKETDIGTQFVVQMQGCPLHCPYCYVTPDGVYGEAVKVTAEELVGACRKSGLHVFHMMGGAPALYLHHWQEIMALLGPCDVFHSDFLLLEGPYSTETLESLRGSCTALYAVSVKGWTAGEFRHNTGCDFDRELFVRNLDLLVEYEIPFYFTYTNMTSRSILEFSLWAERRYGEWILRDSFPIALIKYDALKEDEECEE